MPYIGRFPDGRIQSILASLQYEGQEFLAEDSAEWKAYLLSEKKKDCIAEIKAFARRKHQEMVFQASPEKAAADTAAAKIDASETEADVEIEFNAAQEALK